MQRVIRDYCEQLYVHKLDNLEEMDTFLESYHQPRLIQKEIENLNGLLVRRLNQQSRTSKQNPVSGELY